MSYKVVVTEKAEIDLIESTDWYEVQKKGLGRLLLLSVKDTFKILTISPLLYAKIYNEIRRIMTKKFPFSIFYQINEDKKEVVILAVIHQSRNPEEWKNRV